MHGGELQSGVRISNGFETASPVGARYHHQNISVPHLFEGLLRKQIPHKTFECAPRQRLSRIDTARI